MGDEVLAVTFSEFGRKASENGNLGTDHGEIAPMFVFGSSVSSGISVTIIDLNDAGLWRKRDFDSGKFGDYWI